MSHVSRLFAGQLHGLTEALRGIADNHSHNAARKHDLEIVVFAGRVRHGRDCVRQQQSDAQPKEQAQRQRVTFFAK